MGSVQLGLAYGVANRTGKPERTSALRLVRRAVDAGVTAFDTARAYGDAEDRLGEALSGRPVRTITKLSPLSELSPDASPEALRAAVDESVSQSLSALRSASLDCLLLHRATHMTALGGTVWRRLQEHVAEGRIHVLGVSVQSPAEALAVLEEPLVRHIQLPFNLLDWRWDEAGVIAAFSRRPDVTVHARSVFLQGLLVANDPALWPQVSGINPIHLGTWLESMRCALGRRSVADLALAYARAQDWIDGIVVGMETEDQLETNLALCTCPPLSREDCAAVVAGRPRVPVQLLDPAQWPKR
jgi:aryl-alcohol dehydrogenase-like predicted oxidoreductase